MITVLVYWISCYYNRDAFWLYLRAVLIDLSLIEVLGYFTSKK